MKFDITAIKRKMLVKYPFFGSVVANVEYKEDKNIATAGTDGEVIYYNPDFLESLSIEEQIFIFAHEVCHIAFNHILRSEGKNSEVWNIATDAVINAFLKRDGLKMVEGGVDIAEAINYDAEQLYNKLLEEKQSQQNNQPNQNGQRNNGKNSEGNNKNTEGSNGQSQENNEENENTQGSNSQSQENSDENENTEGSNGQSQENNEENENTQGSNSQSQENSDENENTQGSNGESQEQNQEDSKNNQDVGHDTHSLWEGAIKKKNQEKEKESGLKKLLDKLFDKSNDEDEKSEIEQKQEECEKMGEKDAFKKNVEDKKSELEKLKRELTHQVAQAGTTTNSEIRRVNNIGSSKPLIDWRYVLKEAINYDVDWSYKNATIEDGVISANLEEQPMAETEILLDTSGSISETLLKNFLRECKNILHHSKIKVGCFDTIFYGFHEMRTEDDIENMKFEGGGGTNFETAVKAFSRRVENKIVFTDGEANMPHMPLDAIWIVFGGRKINPPGGKVIYISQEQLDRLISYEQDSQLNKRIR